MRLRILTAVYVVALVAVVILAGGSAGPRLFAPVRALPLGDKLGHFLLMGTLSLLVNLCLSCRAVRVAGARLLLGSVVVLASVAAEEFSQLFLRRRSFDLLDLAFDALGVFLFGRLACLLGGRGMRAAGRARAAHLTRQCRGRPVVSD